MGKTPKQVTKRSYETRKRGKKSCETYMRKLKVEKLKYNQLSYTLSTSTDISTSSTSFSTGNPITRFSNNCVYGVGTVFVLAIVCVFF